MVELEVIPTALVYGGDAMARLPDGRALFVPFGLPGERLKVQVDEEKRGHVRARLVEIIEPSPMRIVPRCIHFGTCGGCHYQHIPYLDQLVYKQRIVIEQLERLGGIANPPVQPVVPSPAEYGYRNNLQFHLSQAGKLAYKAIGGKELLEIQECHLPELSLAETWPVLNFEPGTPVERIGLRMGSGDEILVTLETDGPQTPGFETSLPISAVHLGPAGQVLLAGDDFLMMEVLGRPFQVSAASFFQVNTAQAGRMVEHILARLPHTQASSLLELYCGVGLFSAFLAPRIARLAGVEQSPSACQDFAVNLDEFDNVELYQGAVEDVLPHLDWQPDIVLADPPRAGLEPPAMEALLRMDNRFLVYISCDPATLARDIRRLAGGGYKLVEATPFDMFPQTFHVETVALMSKVK